MWNLAVAAKEYSQRPSAFLHIVNTWAAYQLDQAVLLLASWVEGHYYAHSNQRKDGTFIRERGHFVEQLHAVANGDAARPTSRQLKGKTNYDRATEFVALLLGGSERR